jgi:hypothetical protein
MADVIYLLIVVSSACSVIAQVTVFYICHAPAILLLETFYLCYAPAFLLP